MADQLKSNDELMDGATPFDRALPIPLTSLKGTPSDDTLSLYQGQKVGLSVATAGLNSAGYTSIAFQLRFNDDLSSLDPSKAGLVVHPDSVAKVTQTIHTDADTFSLNAVVLGSVSQTDLAFCRWNVDATGGGSDLTLDGQHLTPSTDYGYGTNAVYANELYGVKQIEGKTTEYDPSKAILIKDYKISDAVTNSVIDNVKFSAFVKGKTGDLTNFDFWDSNNVKLDKIKIGGNDTYVWIDSKDDGSFTFSVTSNLTSGAYSDTLVMQVGNEVRNIAQVIVINQTSVTASAMLPAAQPDLVQGGSLTVPPSDSVVMVTVPSAFDGSAIQPGDMLIPCLGSAPAFNFLLNAFYVADHDASKPYPACFAIPVSALNISEAGEDNVLQYLVVRGAEASLSTNFEFTAYGAPSDGPQPFPSNKRYLAPIMQNNLSYTDITFDTVEDGVTIEINWDGAGWAPNLGDQFTLYLFFDGWNDGAVVNAPQIIKFDPIVEPDLTNKYATHVVDYKYFAGFTKGPQGQQSSVFLQYQVPGGDPAYSIKTRTMFIDTVPPGGV